MRPWNGTVLPTQGKLSGTYGRVRRETVPEQGREIDVSWHSTSASWLQVLVLVQGLGSPAWDCSVFSVTLGHGHGPFLQMESFFTKRLHASRPGRPFRPRQQGNVAMRLLERTGQGPSTSCAYQNTSRHRALELPSRFFALDQICKGTKFFQKDPRDGSMRASSYRQNVSFRRFCTF